jgi:preprotein translocase subunit SecA
VDNQLRGRSGRQGDPGSSQFFVSTEDDLMRIFGGDRIAGIMNRLGVDEDMPIENRVISKSLEGAQKKVEGYNFDARKNVVQYDDVMNRHRKATYAMRREILTQAEIKKRIKLFIEEEARTLANSPQLLSDNFETIVTEVFPFDEKTLDKLFDADADNFGKALIEKALELYDEREAAFTPEIIRKVERDVYLQVLDNLWMEHLENMDHLREGIHWISVGQRDPLVEYRRQSQRMFEEMQLTLRHDVLRTLFHAVPVDPDQVVETDLTRAARRSVDNADRILEAEEFHEADFVPAQVEAAAKKQQNAKRKKARKQERQRKQKAKSRKRK